MTPVVLPYRAAANFAQSNQRRPAGRLLSISAEQFRVELLQRTRALCGEGDARLSGDLMQLWQSGNGEHRQELRVNAWEYGVHDVCLRAKELSEPGLSPLLGDKRQRPTFTLFRQELIVAWESWASLPEAREALDALRWCGYGRLRTVLRSEGWQWRVVSAEIERQMSDERLAITGTAELMGLTR